MFLILQAKTEQLMLHCPESEYEIEKLKQITRKLQTMNKIRNQIEINPITNTKIARELLKL